MELPTDRTMIIALAIVGACLATAKLVAEPEPQDRKVGAFDGVGRLSRLAGERGALHRSGVLVKPLTLSDDQSSFPMLPRT